MRTQLNARAGSKARPLTFAVALAAFAVCGEAAAAPVVVQCSWTDPGGPMVEIIKFDVGEWRTWTARPGTGVIRLHRGGGMWSENMCPGALRCEVTAAAAKRQWGVGPMIVYTANINRMTGDIFHSREGSFNGARDYRTVGKCEAVPDPDTVPPPPPAKAKF